MQSLEAMEDDENSVVDESEYAGEDQDESDEEPVEDEVPKTVEQQIADELQEVDEEDDIEQIISPIPTADRHHLIVHILPDSERRTSHIIQKEEMTEAIGIRASQIEYGAPCLVDTSGCNNPIMMAKKEFLLGANPLLLERQVERRGQEVWVEQWRVREMSLPTTSLSVIGTLKQAEALLGRKLTREEIGAQ